MGAYKFVGSGGDPVNTLDKLNAKPGIFGGIVIVATWKQLQPTPTSTIEDGNPIDQGGASPPDDEDKPPVPDEATRPNDDGDRPQRLDQDWLDRAINRPRGRDRDRERQAPTQPRPDVRVDRDGYIS